LTDDRFLSMWDGQNDSPPPTNAERWNPLTKRVQSKLASCHITIAPFTTLSTGRTAGQQISIT